MRIVSSITSEPRQNFVLDLDNNETVTIDLYYYPTQVSWYFDIEYKGYVNKGMKVVLAPNALRHIRNRIPFGIGFVASSLAEPCTLNTFADGTTLMVLLNQEDVDLFEESYYG